MRLNALTLIALLVVPIGLIQIWLGNYLMAGFAFTVVACVLAENRS